MLASSLTSKPTELEKARGFRATKQNGLEASKHLCDPAPSRPAHGVTIGVSQARERILMFWSSIFSLSASSSIFLLTPFATSTSLSLHKLWISLKQTALTLGLNPAGQTDTCCLQQLLAQCRLLFPIQLQGKIPHIGWKPYTGTRRQESALVNWSSLWAVHYCCMQYGHICKVFYVVLPCTNGSSGVFASISASGVMLANTSSPGHLKFESRLSWFACSPPRVARVIARAKTNLSSVHGN